MRCRCGRRVVALSPREGPRGRRRSRARRQSAGTAGGDGAGHRCLPGLAGQRAAAPCTRPSWEDPVARAEAPDRAPDTAPRRESRRRCQGQPCAVTLCPTPRRAGDTHRARGGPRLAPVWTSLRVCPEARRTAPPTACPGAELRDRKARSARPLAHGTDAGPPTCLVPPPSALQGRADSSAWPAGRARVSGPVPPPRPPHAARDTGERPTRVGAVRGRARSDTHEAVGFEADV